MPGILEDLGIINNGKLSKNTYAGFIADVRRRLRTGIGIIKYPDVGVPTSPIDLQELAQIENKLLFPEFHSIWRERYEKMAQQLNVPGGFGLAPAPPFLIDPVALAKALGAKELPQVKFPDILFEIQGLPPPDGPPIKPPTIQDVINDPVSVKSIDFFDRYLSDLDPLDPAVPANLMKVIGALPVPITPAFPNPILLRYGYTQRYAFENKVYNSHRSTHASMMSQAITLIPNTVIELASGTGCYSLMKATRETALLSQPKPMSTSAFEIAAQEILLQHQIKLESAVILGQMLGSGAILQAVASTPEETGGLGLINTSTTQQNETAGSSQQSSVSSSNPGSSQNSNSTSNVSSSESNSNFSSSNTSYSQNKNSSQQPQPQTNPGFISSQQDNQDDEVTTISEGEGSTSSQPQGFGFDQNQTDDNSYTPDYYDSNEKQSQSSDQPPTGYGFSSPGDDSVPSNAEGQNDTYPLKEDSSGTSVVTAQEQQPTGFGFDQPSEDTNVSGGGQVFTDEEPLDDNYPPEGSGTGQQTYPPGYGDTPTDNDQESSYLQPQPIPEEVTGEYLGVTVPSAYDAQGGPANVGPPIDPKTMYIPEPNSVSYASDEDGDDDFVSSKSSGGSFQRNLSNIRKRIKDLIQGGPSCPAGGGFIGGILGPPPDWSSAATGFATSNATFRGFRGGRPDNEWGKVIPGAQEVIGAGYTTKAELDNYANNPDETNPVQAVATTCTRLPGWLIRNILHNPDDTNTTGRFTVPWDSGSDTITLRNGWPFKAGQTALPNPLVPQAGGLVAPGYIAALLDAWVNIDPTAPNVNPNCSVGDPDKKPKYGDIYLIRGKDKMLRHIGVIVAWNVNEGWIGTADLGQGSIQGQRSQGMAYCKRATSVGDGNAIEMPGEIAQNDEKNKRILMGWIDMDVFIKKLIAMPGMYENSTKPKWLY